MFSHYGLSWALMTRRQGQRITTTVSVSFEVPASCNGLTVIYYKAAYELLEIREGWRKKKTAVWYLFLRTEQACKYWFSKLVQTKKVLFIVLKTTWAHWGAVKLLHLRYSCFVNKTPLPHIPNELRCKWHMKMDCWVYAWLTGLHRQFCSAMNAWGSVEVFRSHTAHTSFLQYSPEVQSGRK